MSQLSKLLAVFAALALLATACGGDSTDTATESTATTAAIADAEESTEAATDESAEATNEVATTQPAPPAPTDDFNGGKPEVVPEGDTPLELGIEDLIVGDGPEAEPGDMLSMHYVGVLHANGEQFDASWDRGATFDFTLGSGQVIQLSLIHI